jgi:hypothetical protein
LAHQAVPENEFNSNLNQHLNHNLNSSELNPNQHASSTDFPSHGGIGDTNSGGGGSDGGSDGSGGDGGDGGGVAVVVGRGSGFLIREVALKKMVIPPSTQPSVARRAIQDFHAEAKMLYNLRFNSSSKSSSSNGSGTSAAVNTSQQMFDPIPNNTTPSPQSVASTPSTTVLANDSNTQEQQQQIDYRVCEIGTGSGSSGGYGHPCIATILGVLVEPLAIITEFCSNGKARKPAI